MRGEQGRLILVERTEVKLFLRGVRSPSLADQVELECIHGTISQGGESQGYRANTRVREMGAASFDCSVGSERKVWLGVIWE